MPTRIELFDAYALAAPEAPHVRMNFVESADGAVTLDGRSGGLGGATDRAVMQVLRAMADVVLVGAGTVRAEGYGGIGLDEDDVAWRREHGYDDQPALAIVSRRLALDPDDDVFAKAVRRPVLVTTVPTPSPLAAGASSGASGRVGPAAPRRRGGGFAHVADEIVCGENAVDLATMLDVFANRGWRRVLCEGGPHLFGSLLDAGLVDEVCLTLAPRFVGGTAGRIAQGAAEADRRFALAGLLSDDEGFVFLRYAAEG